MKNWIQRKLIKPTEEQIFQLNLATKKFQENPDLLLRVKDLNVSFLGENKRLIRIVRGIDLHIKKAEIIALVGESGSGKSVCVKSLLGINEGSKTMAKSMMINNFDFTNFKLESQWAQIRGKKIGYISQDPHTSLNPTRTIGKQLLDAISKKDTRFKTFEEKKNYLIELLTTFGIQDAKTRFNSYPAFLSGGQKQRVVIAMVVAAQPDLIIADEPTTALDPSVQSAVLALLEKIRNIYKISIIFISHNISVVAKFCDYVYVMYAGRIVEKGPKKAVFTNPQHPYTWALISSVCQGDDDALYSIRGTPPDMSNLTVGDPFAPRNDYAVELDFKLEPPLFEVDKKIGHYAATWLLHPLAQQPKKSEVLEAKLLAFKEVFDE